MPDARVNASYNQPQTLPKAGTDRIDPDLVTLAGKFERGRFGEQRHPALVIE
jgi:hypothetical protein